MTDAGLGSRSDLEALQRSGRGKVITLLVLLALALGAAGWYFFGRKQGTGNPEDPAKVLYVGSTRGFSVVLGDVGFEAHEGSFEAWVLKAKEEVPELQVDGLPAIMQLADRFGYGYVIIERPQEVDFAALEVDEMPELPEHVRFAVISVGDLAFPHVVTVNPEPSEVLRGSSVLVLQALFAQERLAEALPTADSSSMDAIQLRDRLSEAIERLEKVPEAERMAAKVLQGVHHLLVEQERAEPAPGLVGATLESGSAFPLANGQLLTVSRGFDVISTDAVRADLDPSDAYRSWVGTPGAPAESRTACETLYGGEISIHESPRYVMANDGSALMVQTLDEGLRLWTLAADAKGCAFEERGLVPNSRPGLESPEPSGHGQVARVGTLGHQGAVSVVTAGSPGNELLLGLLDGVRLERVAWLDATHLVAVAEEPGGAALYFFDTEAPMSVLRLPSTVFENAEVLHEVVAAGPGDAPVVVVTAGQNPRKVYRLDLPAGLSALFDGPPLLEQTEVDPVALDREERGLPAILQLDANPFVATPLTHEGRARELAISRDGSTIAVAMYGEMYDPTAPGDAEIVVVPAKGGALSVVTRNDLEDRDPRLTADGRHVTFETRVEVPRTQWVITSPRIVALPQE